MKELPHSRLAAFLCSCWFFIFLQVQPNTSLKSSTKVEGAAFSGFHQGVSLSEACKSPFGIVNPTGRPQLCRPEGWLITKRQHGKKTPPRVLFSPRFYRKGIKTVWFSWTQVNSSKVKKQHLKAAVSHLSGTWLTLICRRMQRLDAPLSSVCCRLPLHLCNPFNERAGTAWR